MHGGRFAVILLALVGLASPDPGVAGERTITRQNQAAQECRLTVDTEVRRDAERGVDWVKFRITIPKDDRRLERLFSTRFILGTNGAAWPWRVNVPIRPAETEAGGKTFEVSVHRSEVHDAFVEFNCHWPDPTRSSLDGAHLILETYLSDTDEAGD